MGFDLHIGGSFSKHNPLYKSLPVKMYAAIHTGRGKGNIAPWRRREMEDETFGQRNVELWLKTKEGKNDFDSFSTQIFGDIVCLVLHSFAVRIERARGQTAEAAIYKCHVGFCASSSRVCDTHNPLHICAVC